MPRYHVTLTDTEIQELKSLIQKGGKGYRIKHAQILLKLDQKMNSAKLLRYSMQLSMLKQLRSLKLISEAEYQLVEKKLKKDYGVISNITA